MEVFISLFMKYLGYKPMEKLTLLDARTFILDKRRCGISASTCNFYNSSIAFLYKYVLHIPWDQDLVPRMKRDTRLPQLLSMKLCRKLLNCRQYISKLRGQYMANDCNPIQYYFPYTPPQIKISATISYAESCKCIPSTVYSLDSCPSAPIK